MKTIASVTLIILSAMVLSSAFLWQRAHEEDRPSTLAGADNIANEFLTSTNVWVGKDVDTLVAASSTGRTYLQISNLSGATSTRQDLYCNVNDVAVTLYSGLVIFASSTYVFDFDNLYRGSLYCRFPVATSSVAVLER